MKTMVCWASALLVLLACGDSTIIEPRDASPASFEAATGGIGSSEVTIDFSTFGSGKYFDPTFYRRDGILFPAEACGAAGCDPWWAGYFQGDEALNAHPAFGPVTARFTRPISALSLWIAPGLQGTATYTLRAFTRSGKLIASISRTVTEDYGDPDNIGFGYFQMSLDHLSAPAASFELDNVFVRSSFPDPTAIPYGVSTIVFRHWDGKQDQ